MTALLHDLGYPVLAGAGVAGVVLLLGWRPWRRKRAVKQGAWASGLAVGLGMWVTFVMLEGRLVLQPTDRWHWIVFVMGGATLAGMATSVVPQAPLRVAILAGAALVAGWIVGDTITHWMNFPRKVWSAAIMGVIVVNWACLEAAAGIPAGKRGKRSDRLRKPTLPLSLAILSWGGALVMYHAGIASFAALLQTLGLICGLLALFALVTPRFHLLDGPMLVIAIVLPGLTFAGYLLSYSSVPREAYMLIIAGPVGLLIVETLQLARLGKASVATVAIARVAASSGIAAAAVAMAQGA